MYISIVFQIHVYPHIFTCDGWLEEGGDTLGGSVGAVSGAEGIVDEHIYMCI
jgi:hypothetical protein